MTIDFQEDAGQAQRAPDAKTLKSIDDLCQKSLKLEERIATGEALLKELKKERDLLNTRDIPDAMTDVGLSELKLLSGHGVLVEDIIAATPKAANRPHVHGWLREHGFGDLIKNVVTANFGAGEEQLAEAVMLYMEENSFNSTRKESVHPQTLNAFVREQLAKGTQIPEETFGVFRGQKAKIK